MRNGLDDGIIARAANFRAGVQHTDKRSIAEQKLIHVLHLHVVESHVEMFARSADPEPIATVPAAVSCWSPRCSTKFATVIDSSIPGCCLTTSGQRPLV